MTDRQISSAIIGVAWIIGLVTVSVGVLLTISIPTEYWVIVGSIGAYWIGGKAVNGGATALVKRINGNKQG